MNETKRLTLKLKLPVSAPVKHKEVVIIPAKEPMKEKPKPQVKVTPEVKVKAKLQATVKTLPKEPLKKLLLPREEYKKLFEEVCAKYPNLFDINNKRVRILARGIHLQVREKLGWSAKTTRNFFAIFCHAKKYKKMCVKGAKRYDLQGKVVGEVE